MVTSADAVTLSRRAGALAAFTKHPSWPEFELVVDEKIKKLRRAAATLALHEEGADQRKLDQIRGTIAALRWFAGVPPNAQATLEDFLREQGLEVPDE
jgi:hypothetical protein